METENKTAKELFQKYYQIYNDLINTYCQVRQSHPFDTYPELARAIWRMGMVMELWRRVAVRNAFQKHQGE